MMKIIYLIIKLFSIFFMFFTIPYLSIYSKTLIWDLGNTLISTNKFGIAREIGLKDFFLYSIFDWHNPSKIHDHVFNILNLIETPSKKTSLVSTAEGKTLPSLVCQWLEGTKTGNEIYKQAHEIIKEYSKAGYFVSHRQKTLVNRAIKVMFDPKILAKNMKRIRPAVRLLKECANQKYCNGKTKHKLLILSNFDPETFKYVIKSKQCQEVFKYFDPENIIISGHIGLLKPNPKIYDFIIKKYQLNPKDCIFIDDQIENINAAINAGMTGILLENQNYRKLRKKLIELNII